MATETARVLVADDKQNILKLLERVLGDQYDVTTAPDGARALALLSSTRFDVVLTDIRMPGADGFEILREVKSSAPDTEVILMTAYGSVSKAVEAMKNGAFHYLTKPFEPDEAALLVERAVERKRLREQARNWKSVLEQADRFEGMVGNSPAMQKVFDLMRRAAKTDATVLITGESGTGKELVARALHLVSPRRDHRFVPVNCGAIPDTLVESELFGHVKGSFTGAAGDKRGLFEEADGGTIFLDEIVELPLPQQVKLTRVLQEHAIRRVGGVDERHIDVRVIAATNLDLKEAVAGGTFREDLFYRLNVFPIRLPPLRERTEDIPPLAALFLDRHAGAESAIDGFEPDAISALVRYGWPGNVRELENFVLRAVAVSDGPRIGVDALPEEMADATAGSARGDALLGLPFREAIDLSRDRATRDYLVALLRKYEGNVKLAAEHACMERESLYRLLKRHSLKSDDFRSD